ncbi:hypothetical protein [Limimaricola cinnabarinus]|nr:hypothetical protein [Limimaricola cinnabarinus]
MSKTTITPLVLQFGSYGRAEPHVPLQMDSDLAKKLVATGRWVDGKSDVAKRREAAARAVAEEKAEVEKAAAEQAAAEAAAAAQGETGKASTDKARGSKSGDGAAAS